ncbi:MAG TPA: hypothetical protein VGD40_14945 [Chryseosolibacter sp.]
MKTFLKILLIAMIFIAGTTTDASAQRKRADKTSSAKAYYGQTPAKPQSINRSKQRKATKVKSARSQSAKRIKAQAWNRKKYS